ncbi:MAG: hypothetical protein RJA36_3756 [Pseudomonadota bacterium]|jgi:hypothetical protein
MTDDQVFAWAFHEEEYKQAMELVAEISAFLSLPAEKPSELDIKKKRLGSARSRLDEIITGLAADPSVPRQMIDEVRRCRDAAELVGLPAESQSLSAPLPAVFVQVQLSCVQANQGPATESVSSAQAKVEQPLPSEPPPAPAPTASVELERCPIEQPELEPLPELGLASGDLLISRANTRELVGSAAVALRDFPRLMLCDKLYRLRLRSDTSAPVFLAMYLGIPRVRGQIELSATGASSSMLNIGQSTILELDVAVPPSDELAAITVFVDRETAKIDELVAEAQSAINLLQERRTALISAAVTGQIDVRGLASC